MGRILFGKKTWRAESLGGKEARRRDKMKKVYKVLKI
jgi:hypothetical protein